MSITPRLGTGYTLSTDYTTYSAASSSTAVLAKPSGVVDGVTLRAFVFSQVAAGATMTPPSGWTLELGLTARRGGVYRKVIPSAAAETATSYTWTAASAGRVAAVMWISTGEDGTTPVDVTGTWSAEATTATAASVTAAGTDLLMEFVYWNDSSATTTIVSVPGTSTKLIDVGSPTTGNTSGIAVGMEQLSGPGSTGTRAFTGSPTPTNMSAALIAFVPSAGSTLTGDTTQTLTLGATATGTVNRFAATSQTVTITPTSSGVLVGSNPDTSLTVTLTPTAGGLRATFGAASQTVTLTPSADASSRVTRFLAAAPTYTAHRGGSADWPEMTMFAYAQAAAWNKNMALEVSCIRTSDGLWMASHDSTTDRVFGTHYDITTTLWSTLQTLRTTVGNQPPCLLTDVLAAYPDRVIVVDNKMSSFLAPWLDLLDTYGGADRIIVKGYGPQSADMTKADAAIARGYKTWGYYYHADTANLASTQSHWSILGEDAVGAPPGDATDWAAIKSYGKPVWAHIIATAAQKTYASGFSPDGYMVSGVMEAVPQTATGDTTQTVTVAPTATGIAGRVADTTLTVALSPAAAGLRVIGGDTALTVGLSPNVAGVRGALAGTSRSVVFSPVAAFRQPVAGDTTLQLVLVPTSIAGGRDIELDATSWPTRWMAAPAAAHFAAAPESN